jgi:hypothetical protein
MFPDKRTGSREGRPDAAAFKSADPAVMDRARCTMESLDRLADALHSHRNTGLPGDIRLQRSEYRLLLLPCPGVGMSSTHQPVCSAQTHTGMTGPRGTYDAAGLPVVPLPPLSVRGCRSKGCSEDATQGAIQLSKRCLKGVAERRSRQDPATHGKVNCPIVRRFPPSWRRVRSPFCKIGLPSATPFRRTGSLSGSPQRATPDPPAASGDRALRQRRRCRVHRRRGRP